MSATPLSIVAYNIVMITGSPSLRVLNVGGNIIGDDGISLCLQHINTLTELRVWGCRLSVEGILSISVYAIGHS